MSYYNTENDVLQSINQFFPDTVFRGDDCACLPLQQFVTSVDIVGDGLDFRLNTFPPEAIGHKALAVNISDTMAMGAIPSYFLMALSIPRTLEKEYFHKILSGMKVLAQEYNVTLIGGDIAFDEYLRFAITIFGKSITSPISRGNTSVGDSIFYIPSLAITKPLGLARVGFDVLENNITGYHSAVMAQQKPALLAISVLELLAPFAKDIALMDCSDGLMQDIPRLIRKNNSTLGVTITLTETMLHNDVIDWALYNKFDPLEYAFIGGEEYCLIGTAPIAIFEKIALTIPHIVVLGTVTHNSNIVFNGSVYNE